jgi:hypothetical protein
VSHRCPHRSPATEPTPATPVEQRAARYADELEEVLNQKTLHTERNRLLDDFEQYIVSVLDEYPARRRGKSHELLFRSFYALCPESVETERRRALLVALMAAEVEAQGPLRLTMAQNKNLAEILENLGKLCVQEKLLPHAAEAFERAAEIHLLTNDHESRDRCLYQQAWARHRLIPLSAHRALVAFSGLTCGYGYRPYRLLRWVIVQLLLFWVTLSLFSTDSIAHNLHVVAVNYLNPADTPDDTAKAILIIESYLGTLSLNVFFALLVRKWFR